MLSGRSHSLRDNLGWVRSREQVLHTCCREPQMLTFLISGTSIIEALFTNQGVSFPCVNEEKTVCVATGSSDMKCLIFLL